MDNIEQTHINTIKKAKIYFWICASYLLIFPGALYGWYQFSKWLVSNHENYLWLPMPILGGILVLSYVCWKFFINILRMEKIC